MQFSLSVSAENVPGNVWANLNGIALDESVAVMGKKVNILFVYFVGPSLCEICIPVQEGELSTRTWSGRVPWNRGNFVCQSAKRPLKSGNVSR